MDTLVFDIETQNFFTDPGVGKDNFEALKISALGVYSYKKDAYFCFEESEVGSAAELFASSGRLVGFSINRYDVPVLNAYFRRLSSGVPSLWDKERVDLLEEIQRAVGERISLSRLAEVNLGVKKDRRGAEAVELFRAGRMAELKEYCLNDVRLTKQLYDRYRIARLLLVPAKRTGEIKYVEFPGQHALL